MNRASNNSGYRFYIGNNSRVYDRMVDVGQRDNYCVDIGDIKNDDRTYFFAVTAYRDKVDESTESDYSVELAMRYPFPDTSGSLKISVENKMSSFARRFGGVFDGNDLYKLIERRK